MEHGSGSPSADVKGGHRFVPYHAGIAVDFGFHGRGVSSSHFGYIKLFIIRTVRTYLLAEGNMKVDPELIDFLIALLERWNLPLERDAFLFGDSPSEIRSDKSFEHVSTQ